MPRWLAVCLGCLTALGMQALFSALLPQSTASAWSPLLGYLALLLALVLAGYVTGHLVGRWQVVYAALTAVVYIMVTATVQATRDAVIAHQLGLAALAPLDFIQLTLTDVLAMTAACCGGWLAERSQITPGPS
ncbi:MAG: hypothetical protein M3069_33665 [Chloroflexota bacterium]|nr:hypothetical protein [Chloroflexota bacterium]